MADVQLWLSRHLHTGLVALSVFEHESLHPARAKALPWRVRVVDQRTAEVAQALARDRAATAKAAGKVPQVDLDELVRSAEERVASAGEQD